MSYPEPLTRLVDQLKRLPGIGAKSAQRLAFHILRTPRDESDRLIDAIRDVKDRVTYCSVCSNTTDVDPCMYCSSETRNHNLICVVDRTGDDQGICMFVCESFSHCLNYPPAVERFETDCCQVSGGTAVCGDEDNFPEGACD